MFYSKGPMPAHDEGRRGDREHGTIPRLLRRSAERFGSAAAIECSRGQPSGLHAASTDQDVTLSFTDLRDAAGEAARALIASGVQAGDHVAIWAPNAWEWIVAALAVHAAGGALVPINTRFKGPEAAHVIAKSGARLVFTVQSFLGAEYVAW